MNGNYFGSTLDNLNSHEIYIKYCLLTHPALLDQNVADHGSLLGFQIVLTDLSLFVLIFFICTGDINERDILPIIPFVL